MPPDSFSVAVLLRGISVVVSGNRRVCARCYFREKQIPRRRVEGPSRQYMIKSKLVPIQDEKKLDSRAFRSRPWDVIYFKIISCHVLLSVGVGWCCLWCFVIRRFYWV